MTEYTDTKGNSRIRWGLVEWIGAGVVSLLCTLAIGVGSYAWFSIQENNANLQTASTERAVINERLDNHSYWISDLADTKQTLSAILARLDDITRRLDRLDERVDNQN